MQSGFVLRAAELVAGSAQSRQQLAEPPDMLRAEALRQSMLGLVQQPGYAHPAFWAAFGLNRDGGR